MKKILITGASGFVGSRVVARWRNEYAVLAPTHAELDITDRESVNSYFLQHTPDVVVHLAALSNTGYCEQNPEDSYRVNVEGAANIARAAALCRAKLIFFSSDQVYNGNLESGLLNEDVVVAPENVYGRHKLEAEERVLYFNPNTVVLRATWMYDRERESMPSHANFVLNIASYDGRCSFSTWVYGIALHLCIDRLRKQKPILPLPGDEDALRDCFNYNNPQRRLENKEWVLIVRLLAGRLSVKQHLVFTLCQLEGLETAEVERITGMSADKIKKNLYVARQTIREQLKKMGYE